MLRVHPGQATKGNNELAGAQNRSGRGIWRSVRDATPRRPGPPGPDYGSSPQRGGSALPFELHNARVRGDGSAEGGAYGVCRTYCTPTQLPVANKDEQVLLHNILIHAAALRLRQTVIYRAAQTEPNGCMGCAQFIALGKCRLQIALSKCNQPCTPNDCTNQRS